MADPNTSPRRDGESEDDYRVRMEREQREEKERKEREEQAKKAREDEQNKARQGQQEDRQRDASPRTGVSSRNPVRQDGSPEHPFDTNEKGAMVPNINRIPGDREYDAADELKPMYDLTRIDEKPYEHVHYMTSTPDLSNPNDLQSPLNPKNMDEAPTPYDPYATPGTYEAQVKGKGPVRRFDPSRPGDPTNPSTNPREGQSLDPARSPNDPNKPVQPGELPDVGQANRPGGATSTTYNT